MFQKHLRKLKIIKAQALLELVVNALTRRPTLLGNNIRKKKKFKVIQLFIGKGIT